MFATNKRIKSGKAGHCKVCAAAYVRKYMADKPELAKANHKAFLEKNPGYREAYRKANRKHIKEYNKQWVDNNPEYHKNYLTDNLDKHSEIQLKRRNAIKERTPCWHNELHEMFFKEALDLRDLRRNTTGQDWEIDHIIPLQGKYVSGLHIPENIQVILATHNAQKGVTYDVW